MSSNGPQDGSESSPAPSIKPVSLSLSKGAAKKTGFNLQSSAQNTDSPSRTLARRPHHLHHDDDSDEGGDEPAFESVTGFDTLTGKTISADAVPEKGPLTIPVTSKNNWRDRPGVIRRKGKNLLPREVQAMQEAQKTGIDPGSDADAVGPSMSYGLSFAPPGAGEEMRRDSDEKMEDPGPVVEQKESKPLTEDEIALRALVRESKGEVERRSDLVIESGRADEEEEEDIYDGQNLETKSFRADVASRPEPASLDQYNAIPVEEFGAALLRGMGWKEGQAVGKGKYGSSDPSRATTPHVPARRPGFLGIGAKDVSGGKAEVEFGAWGKAAMRKGSRKAGEGKGGERNTEGIYMPVMMRNKKTGEAITEEELATLKKAAKSRDDEDWKERRDRNLERSKRDRDRDRDRGYRRSEYERDGDSDRSESRRNGSSRRDRSRSISDRYSRRRRYDDDDGGGRDDRCYRDRDRDPDRDRERDQERRSDRDRDRERDRDRKGHRYDDDRYSSRHSSSKESSRHRGRDRDRESDRDSYRRRKYDDR
ncbi:DExH-box splicing factor binding site-domain-containing protein [Aspergillus egyptiacus]|nr:DExH-box splicing factor binding site-domain-containing protein [Aspergillus egyptiacus]